ncbi:MAG: tRNA guanosine(15) transglycosylase TgtA [Candidatus Hermodarchaeia archaeon]|jgi:7-cyano-7-deazaguanine tRNA-ribosyltransferase
MIEIIHKDLLARIAKFRTKSGIVDTPAFIPVVHPTKELITPKRMYHEFDCQILITNAYLLSKSQKKGKIHDILDFPGSIMTDSGAYQLLIYGDVSTTPNQIIQFQEEIETDIAVILDVPTGGKATYNEAQFTVEETLRRAKASVSQRKKSDILWVGPIQGGTYPDLVANSAQQISKLDFSIYAIGSPTQLMEQYKFNKLVDLVLSAKNNIPFDKPVHLFGAGHPLIFPLIVALGCDLFDSAAYALFAKHDRILSAEGTYRLAEIQDEFCTCPSCSQYTIAEMKQLEKKKRVQVLAEHNLHICQNEIKRIKQAIRDGRLWRLVESRLSSHPALVDAMYNLQSSQSLIEQLSPITKKRALYITSSWSFLQPEVYRHRKRIENYSSPEPRRNTLLLFSAPTSSPYHSSKEYERFRNQVRKVAPDYFNSAETLFISPVFGLVPLELTNYYPLAQNMVPQNDIFNLESVIIEQLKSYLSSNPQFNRIYGIFGQSDNWKSFTRRCRQLFKQLKKNFILSTSDFSKESLNTIIPKLISKIK